MPIEPDMTIHVRRGWTNGDRECCHGWDSSPAMDSLRSLGLKPRGAYAIFQEAIRMQGSGTGPYLFYTARGALVRFQFEDGAGA